ncbi:21170_t:CDS:2, partial [Rhizophagus irregularis]
QFPNGMQRTSFMTRLDEDLGELCMTCNECGYSVFAKIEKIIESHVTDPDDDDSEIKENEESSAEIVVPTNSPTDTIPKSKRYRSLYIIF